jgi:antitoxin component YwqK of YwqJK toxin-antitoxin module
MNVSLYQSGPRNYISYHDDGSIAHFAYVGCDGKFHGENVFFLKNGNVLFHAYYSNNTLVHDFLEQPLYETEFLKLRLKYG